MINIFHIRNTLLQYCSFLQFTDVLGVGELDHQSGVFEHYSAFEQNRVKPLSSFGRSVSQSVSQSQSVGRQVGRQSVSQSVSR